MRTIFCKQTYTIKTDVYYMTVAADTIDEAIRIFKKHRPTEEILSIHKCDNCILIDTESL